MPYFAMRASTQRQQAIIRSVALLQTLKRRVGASSVYAFAEHFDALANPETPTQGQGRNGWQALFNGVRPLSPNRLRALASVPAWADAKDLYEQGPASLWLAMWGPQAVLQNLFKSELTEWKTVDQLLPEFEGDLLLAEAYAEPLTVHHLTKSVALHRIHRAMAALAPLELNGSGTARCIRRCLDNASIQLELDALALWSFVDHELSTWLTAENDPAEAQASPGQRWNVIEPRLTWVG